MKNLLSLWVLVLYIILIATVITDCSIKLTIFIATAVLTGVVGMFKEELKEELKNELKSKK
jgi:hypothetical protein